MSSAEAGPSIQFAAAAGPASVTPTPASTSASSDVNLQITNLPAVVSWSNSAEQDNALRYLSHSTHDHLHFSVHRDVDSNTAFLQLRANVALKNRRDRTNVFLSVPPENIQALALVDNDEGMEVAMSKLGTSTRCLRFDLRQSPVLTVPKGDITPKQRTSRIVLDSLRALTNRTVFSVHLPSAKLLDAHIAALCTAVTSGTLRSTERFLDIASLYGGKGGRTLGSEASLPPPPADTCLDPEGQADSPPSYDESSAGQSQPIFHQKPGTKRRRASSGSDPASSSRPRQFVDSRVEDICLKMMARIDHGFGELGSRLDRMEQRLSDLEVCVGRHAETLTANIQQTQDRSSEQLEEMRHELDIGLYDVRKETQDIITTQVEDEMFVARDHLEDFVKDEMAAIEERLEMKLEDDLATANVSLEFSWNR